MCYVFCPLWGNSDGNSSSIWLLRTLPTSLYESGPACSHHRPSGNKSQGVITALSQGSSRYTTSGGVLKCGSQASSTSLPWELKTCKFSGHSPALFKQAPVDSMPAKLENQHAPPQFRQKAILEKIHKALNHHISDDIQLTSSNDLCGRITIWDSYDRTLTNSGDSGTLGCSTALARKEARETEDCLYTQGHRSWSYGVKAASKLLNDYIRKVMNEYTLTSKSRVS